MKLDYRTVCLGVLATMFAVTAAATSTESFLLDDAKSMSGGDQEGTAVNSDGTITRGAAVHSIPIEHVPVAYSLARQPNGTVFIGAGMDGQIFKLRGTRLTAHARTEQLLVASLAIGPKGQVFAGTLPEGRIFRVFDSGKIEEIAQLPDTKHVWGLAYDKKRKRLLAATGPDGRLFAVNAKSGKAKELYKADASHLMSLALAPNGDAYVGTSDDAVVVRVTPNGNARVVHDFPGNEVTALAFRAGKLAVVANEFKQPPAQFLIKRADSGTPPGGFNFERSRPKPGKGKLFVVGSDGRVELMHADKSRHFTAVQWRDKGGIYLAEGVDGSVLRVHDNTSYSTWLDSEARQVLAIDLNAKPGVFITSDGATVNLVDDDAPRNPTWTSKALDARFRSKWGHLTWRGDGSFRFQTRSGNTEKPDDTWSSWSKKMKNPGRVQSGAARFIQVRALFPSRGAGTLRAVELFYLSDNQRARVSRVRVDRKPGKAKKAATKYPLVWEVDNPDKDALRYRLQFREESQTVWRDVFREDHVLTGNRYEWETDSIPDGYYIVRVDASDEQTNPKLRTERAWATSEPIRIDNHPPRVVDLAIKRGRLTGEARDGLGPIARIEVAFDSQPWRDVFPTDELLDRPVERFSVALEGLGAGSHIIAVRATDAAGNVGSAEIEVKTKR